MQHHQDNTANDALHYKGSMFGGAFWRYLDCLYAVIHEKRDDLLAIFTIVLAFSTILLWVATRDLANDAVESSRLELRAYVGANHPKFGKPDADDITIVIENFGQTPAYKVSGWINMHWIIGADSALPDGFKFPDKEPTADFALYSSLAVLHPRKDSPFVFAFDPKLLERCGNKEIALWFYGHFDYVDIFDKAHETRFCYQYFPIESGIGHSLVMYDEYNEAT
jgi:hypothetical protein